MRSISNLSIAGRTGLLVGVSLTFTLSAMLIILQARQESTTWSANEQHMLQTKGLLVKSITVAMSSGMSDVGDFQKSAASLNGMRELHILPTNFIRPNNESVMDREELASVKSKVVWFERQKFNGELVMRMTEPVSAEERCTSCHQVAVGDPLTVVSMRISIEDANQAIMTSRWLALGMALPTVLATLLAVLFFFGRAVVRPRSLSA